MRFQDRRLNKCCICGTKKALAVVIADDGKVLFMCEAHALLSEILEQKVNEWLKRMRQHV